MARRQTTRSHSDYPEDYRDAVDKFLAFLGPRADQSLALVTKGDVLEYRTRKLEKVSYQTTSLHMQRLSNLFGEAEDDDLILLNPVAKLKPLKKTQRLDPPKREFTHQELNKLFDYVKGDWRTMTYLGLYLGQRLMDVARVRWCDIDLAKDNISLLVAKTHQTRTLYIAQPLRAYLSSLPRPINDDTFLCQSLVGLPGSTLSHQFRAILRKAGIVKKSTAKPQELTGAIRCNQAPISFHSLRHTCVTVLKEMGVPDSVVMAHVGHKSIAMSAHYTHVGAHALEDAVAKFPAYGRAA